VIESTIDEAEEEPINSFPKVMIREGGQIVLFRETERGMVVRQSPSGVSYKIGFYSETWSMDRFKDYNGPVTIQNK